MAEYGENVLDWQVLPENQKAVFEYLRYLPRQVLYDANVLTLILKTGKHYIVVQFHSQEHKITSFSIIVENNGESEREVLLNSNRLVTGDENGQLFETGSDARYISQTQDPNIGADKKFHYMLNPGQGTKEIEISYILEDSYLEQHLYYLIGNAGSKLGNSSNRFLPLNFK